MAKGYAKMSNGTAPAEDMTMTIAKRRIQDYHLRAEQEAKTKAAVLKRLAEALAYWQNVGLDEGDLDLWFDIGAAVDAIKTTEDE